MRFYFIFLLIFVLYSKGVHSQRVSIIGSQFIPKDSNYKVILLTTNLDEESFVNVSLLSDGFESTQQLRNLKDDSYSEINFKVPQQSSINYELKIKTVEKDKCSQQSIKLIKSHEGPRIFIQLDKPIYKTGDEFKFRIFALNKMLIPLLSHGRVDVSIHDSMDNTIQKFDDIKTENGVYEGVIKIADSPNLGRWKIVTNVMGRKIVKSFNVQKSVKDGLEVQLEMTPVVTFQDKRIFMTIMVNDKTDKFFVGTASVSASARFKGSDKILINHHVKDVDIFGNKKGVAFDFADDLGIRFPTADMMLKFDVILTDTATKRSTKVSKEIEMKFKIRNTIQVVRKKYFKPGFKLPTKIRVKLLDGRLDNSFYQLTVTNEYHNRNKKTNKIQKLTKAFKVNLKNGETSNVLQTKSETEAIVVKLEFAGAELLEEILPLPTFGANEYLQISLGNRSTTIGDKILISALTTGEMETLHVLVIGQEGIIHSQEFPDAVGLDIFKFTIKLTEEMKPEARVLAFYVKPESGVIIYDEILLNLGFSIDNSIEIFAAQSAQPNEQATIKFKTVEGSKVFLSASDINPLSIERGNEISRTDIYNELVYYLNLKYPNASDYHFEKLNAFILNPLQSKDSCEDGTTKLLSYESNENGVTLPNNNDVMFFPDVWFDKSYDTINDKEQVISHKVPEAMTTWRYFGISVHPTKGFTVAKVQPKTTVKSEISIQLKAPTSASDGEILWIDVAVFNSLQEEISSDVSVTLENGYFVEKNPRIEYNIKCLDFQQANTKSLNFQFTIGDGKLSTSETFLIQPDGSDDIVVKVKASARSYSDEVTKVIKLEKIMISKDLDNEKLSEDVNTKSDTEPSYMNILTSALGGLESFFKNPLTSDEERILKFSTSITSYKYLQLGKNDIQDAFHKKALNDLIAGYQEALAILDKILLAKDPNSITLAAMITETLIEARQFINVDQNLITKAFDFIKAQQLDDGLFYYDSSFDYREEMGDNRKDIQGAQIITAFLKNENRNQFQNLITKTLEFIKDSTISSDYQRAAAAYAFALNKDNINADNLLNNMENEHSVSSSEPRKAVDIEVEAYKILTKILLEEDPKDEIKWLLKQQNKFPGFYSPYDADLALRAFYEYAKCKNLQPDDNILNSVDLHSYKPSEQGNFNHNPANTSDYFIISANRIEVSQQEFKIDVTVNLKGDRSINNLIIFEMELPRGFKFLSHDQNNNILSFDVLNNGNLGIFRMNKLKKDQIINLSIQATKVFEFSNHKFSMIKVYDYYRSNIKDTFYYVYDKNEESCERIRVEREIEKAENILLEAQSAQTITSEAQSVLVEAENYIKNAQKHADIASQNIESANATIIETQGILSKAFETASISHEITAHAVVPKNVKSSNDDKISVLQVRSVNAPKRVRRDISESESEAIKTQRLAFEAKQVALEANKTELIVEDELTNAIADLDKAEKEEKNAKIEVSEALSEVQAAQMESKTKQESILEVQKNANETEENIYKTDKNLSSTIDKLNLTKTTSENTKTILKNTQERVNKAVTLAINTLEKAKNALKGVDVQVEVDKAAIEVKNSLTEAEKTLETTKSTKQQALGALISTGSAQKSSEEIKAECENSRSNAKSIQQEANDVLAKSQEKCNKYKKAQEVEAEKTNLATEAKKSLSKAEEKSKNAKKDSEIANLAANEAQNKADKARTEEAKQAESNARNAKDQVAIIEKIVLKISNLTAEAIIMVNETKNIRNEVNEIMKNLEVKQFSPQNAKKYKSDREADEKLKIKTLNEKIEAAQNLTSEANILLINAELDLLEASEAARKALKSTDAIETTNESKKVIISLNKLKNLAKDALTIQSSLEKISTSCSESKTLAEKMKETTLIAKIIHANALEVVRNLNAANNIAQLITKSISTSKDEINKSRVKQFIEDLKDLEKKVNLNIGKHKNKVERISRNAFSEAENARKTTNFDYAITAKKNADTLQTNAQNSKDESESIKRNIEDVQKIVAQAFKAVNFAIQAKENTVNLEEIVKSVENTQVDIDSVLKPIFTYIQQIQHDVQVLSVNQDSLMDSFMSLLQHFNSKIEAGIADKNLANLTVEAVQNLDDAANKAIDAARNAINANSSTEATEFKNQADISLNDTIKYKIEITKINEIATLALQASKAVTKAAEAFQKSYNEASSSINAENALKVAQVSAVAVYNSLNDTTDAKDSFDKINNLVLTGKAATVQTYQATINALNELIYVENYIKSIEGSYNYEDIEEVKKFVESANEAAENAKKEAETAKNGRKDVKRAELEAQEALEAIMKIADNERAAKELQDKELESKIEDLQQERNTTQQYSEPLIEEHENVEESEQNLKIEAANAEFATIGTQTIDERVDVEQESSINVQEAVSVSTEIESTSLESVNVQENKNSQPNDITEQNDGLNQNKDDINNEVTQKFKTQTEPTSTITQDEIRSTTIVENAVQSSQNDHQEEIDSVNKHDEVVSKNNHAPDSVRSQDSEKDNKVDSSIQIERIEASSQRNDDELT